MKKPTLSLALLLALCAAAHTAGAQSTLKVNTAPGNTDARAIISATNPGDPDLNDGLIIPRISVFPGDATSLNAGIGPVATAQGMLVYLQQSYTATAGTPGVTAGQVYPTGFYYWSGGTGSPANTWLPLGTRLSAPNSPDWKLTGNTGTTPGGNTYTSASSFLGTNDNQDLVFRRNTAYAGRIGTTNTELGVNAHGSNTTGTYNTVIGADALASATTSANNVAIGNGALYSQIGNGGNIAIGGNAQRLSQNTSGNVALGPGAMSPNVNGFFNTAIGCYAHGGGNLVTEALGDYNTALGASASTSVGGLSYSVAIGGQAKVGASNCMVLGGTGIAAVNVGIGMTVPLAKLHVKTATAAELTPMIIEGCRTYADDTAAGAAGLTSGMIYKTAAGVLMIKN